MLASITVTFAVSASGLSIFVLLAGSKIANRSSIAKIPPIVRLLLVVDRIQWQFQKTDVLFLSQLLWSRRSDA